MLNSEIYGAEVWGLIGSLQQAEQARRMQMPSVWLPEPAIEPGPPHAKSPLQPGSGGTEELTVSGEPGQCGATLGTQAVKSSG